MFRLIILFLVLSGGVTHAMTFSVQMSDIRAINRSYDVYADGEIVDGDADRLLEALRAANIQPNRPITVYLHSPGGSVVEALKLGRLIGNLKADTNIGRKGSPGLCISACVWAYLGGSYRFLSAGSRIGVHQF